MRLAAGLALAAFACLAGCATTGSQPAGPASATESDMSAAAAEPAGSAAAADALPDNDLSGELLFRLVFSEIALQRGEPSPAYAELMRAAAETHDPRIAHRATEIAIAVRALPQALEAAELWYSYAPADREAESTYVALLVANGRHQRAQPLLARELAQSARPLEVLERVQRMVARAPEPAQGRAMLERLAKPYLDDPASAYETHLILARAAHAAGDNKVAIEQVRAALALRPDSEAAIVAVAQLLVEGGSAEAPAGATSAAPAPAAAHAEAAALLAQFLQGHPDALDARLAYARVLVGADRLEEAQQQFAEVSRRAPRNPDALFALGVLALEAEHFDESRGDFQRYIELLGASSGHDLDLAYMNLSRVAEGQHRYEEALDWLHHVTAGGDQAAGAREREAFVLVRLNRAEDGLALLRQMPGDTAEERTQRDLLLGQLLRDAHRYRESFDLLEGALQGSPDDAGLLYETAMSAERLDKVDVMEARLRRLLQLHPDYAHAYNALGYSFADRNIRLQEAYQLIDHALSLSPDDGFIVDSMGWVQYRLGNLAAARDSLTRAFRLKADPDVAAHLGEVLWALGDRTGARTLLLEAQKRDGDSDTLRETLQRLNIRP